MFKDDDFWGLITLGLNFQYIVEDAKLGQVQAGMEVALRNDVGHILYGPEAVFDMAPVTQRLSGFETDWILAGVPASGWDASIQDTFLPFQAAGVSVVSLLTLLVFLVMSQQSRLSMTVQQRTESLRQAQGDLERRVQLRTAELTQANDDLKAEMSVRTRIARQLRESETLYRTLVTASPDAVIVANQRGRVTFASATALRMFDYDYPEDMFGVSVLSGIGKPDRARARDRVRCLLDGHPWSDNDEFVLRGKTGRRFVGEVSLACLYTDDGAPNGFVSIVRDVTHRVEMQDALRRAHEELEARVQERTRQLAQVNAGLQAEIAERRLAEQQVRLQTTAMEAAANGILITNRNGVIEWCNPALVQMTGYLAEEMIGRTPRLFQSGQHSQQFYARLWSTILAGRTWSGEIINRRKDGSLYAEEQTIAPVLDESGAVTHIIAIKQDITDRRRAEDVLRLNAARTAALLDLSRALVAAGFDRQYILEVAVRGAGQLAGGPCMIHLFSADRQWLNLATLASSQMLTNSKGCNSILMTEPYPVTAEPAVTVINTRQPVLWPQVPPDLFQNVIQPRYGWQLDQAAATSLIIAPLRLSGEVVGLLTVWREKPGLPLTIDDQLALQWLTDRTALAIDSARLYTDLQRSLQQEQATRRQLVQAETFAAMGRIVATVAHELNNPLQTIRNCLYLIEQEIPEDISLYEYFRMAATEFERLSDLVAQLRTLQRSRMPVDLQLLNLQGLIEEVYVLVQAKLEAHAVEWQLSVETTETEVLGAIDQLKQVCLNISLNAIEAMQPDGGVLRVSLLASADGDQVGMRFQDSGPGITPENLSKIFEPLFTTKSNGLGLGLPICYEIMQRHNGRLTVDSQPAHGATFTAWLPLVGRRTMTV